MAKRKYSPEQIIDKLRAIELTIAQRDTVAESCRKAAINVHAYYRWRSRYEGMTIAEAKENKRLREKNTCQIGRDFFNRPSHMAASILRASRIR